jgi:hypothetical protein
LQRQRRMLPHRLRGITTAYSVRKLEHPMCLNKITRIHKKPSNKVRTAWKVFSPFPGELHFPYFSWKGSSRVPMGKWLKAKRNIWEERYPPGFHAFETKAGAEAWRDAHLRCHVCVRVLLRGVETVGHQGALKTLVAREMFVPEENYAAK